MHFVPPRGGRRARRGEALRRGGGRDPARPVRRAQNVQALNLLALVRYKLGTLEEAHATYREIAGTAPQDAHARRNLGLIALKLGHVDEALPELEMAVRLAPGDDRAWSYLGYAYAKKGEVVEAAAAFRRAGQDALALELEHAATVRRPPTPSMRSPEPTAGGASRGGRRRPSRARATTSAFRSIVDVRSRPRAGAAVATAARRGRRRA